MKRIRVVGATVLAILGVGLIAMHFLREGKLNAIKVTLRNVASVYSSVFGDAIQHGTHRFRSSASAEFARLIPDYIEDMEEIPEIRLYSIIYADDYETNSRYDLPLVIGRREEFGRRIPFCTKSGGSGILTLDSKGRLMLNYDANKFVDILQLISSGVVKELK